MNPHPTRLDAVLDEPPAWTAGDVAFWELGRQGSNRLWLGRFGPQSLGRRSPWERHLEGDELLHVLSGAVDVTLLFDTEQRTVRLETGSLFLVPAGVWHAHAAASPTIEFGATPGKSEHSMASDPRLVPPQSTRRSAS
jgi:mannose-6-phosphate isomerase-like protein (cupin superfamily)